MLRRRKKVVAQDRRRTRPTRPQQPGVLDYRESRRHGASRRQLKLLSQSALLEESGPPRITRLTILAISLFVLGAVGWSSITQVVTAAVANGAVAPASRVSLVQHLEGGVIAEIFVADGDLVEQGQTLLRMDGAADLADLEQMRARYAALSLQAERLRAFAMNREADFEPFIASRPELVFDQIQILQLARETADGQRAVLESRIAQRETEVDVLVAQRASLERQLAAMREEVDMRERLAADGLTSRLSLLEARRELTGLEGAVTETEGAMEGARQAVVEARNSVVEFDLGLKRDALTEMGRVAAELAEVRETMARLEDRVARLNVTAPARGVVKGLMITTPGEIAPPGAPLMEIVPMDETLVVEARVKPADIGHIQVGQPVQIMVIGYDVARYGAIHGVVSRLSASTFTDQNGAPYYRAMIALDSNMIGRGQDQQAVLPGMVVQASITIGEQSLLAYLIKPVYNSLASSFHER